MTSPFPSATLFRTASLLISVFIAAGPALADKPARAPTTRAPVKSAPASKPAKPCDCVDPYRSYAARSTPAVVALWAAARASDEAEFMRWLPQVGKVGDYADDGVPLLAALLRPAGNGERKTYFDMSADESAALVERHRKAAPALVRMVSAALQSGASPTDLTSDAPLPPLHLAMVFGSPEIVRVLLAGGAKVDQVDARDGKTALELMLDQEFLVRMSGQPPLVSRDERSDMVLQLLNAGAARPFKRADQELAKQGTERPAADYLAWSPLVALTNGGDVLRALAKTGTRPVIDVEDEQEPSVLAVAAANDNPGALAALHEMLPAASTNDRAWNVDLDAALAAAAAGHMALARSLVKPGMPWEQVGPRGLADKSYAFKRFEAGTGTLLQFVARSGDTAWLRQLVALGARVDGDPDGYAPTPLAEAMDTHREDVVSTLLALGADPLQRPRNGKAPLVMAIDAGEPDTVRAMLAPVASPRGDGFKPLAGDIAEAWAASDVFDRAPQRESLRASLAAAGFKAADVRPAVLASLIGVHGSEVARLLIAGGAPLELDAQDAAFVDSPLAAAVLRSDMPVVDALLARGASATTPSASGTPIQVALRRGDLAMVDRLLGSGSLQAVASQPGESALDLAVLSGNLAMVDQVIARTNLKLADSCPDKAGDAGVLLRDEATFDALADRGLAFQADCAGQPPLLERIVTSLLTSPGPLMPARRRAVARMLKRADPSGGAAVRVGPERLAPLHAAIAMQRQDLVATFLDSGASASSGALGWLATRTAQPEVLALLVAHGASLEEKTPQGPTLAEHVRCRESEAFRRRAGLPEQSAGSPCPKDAPMTVAEQSIARKLVGHYYLKGVTEVGSELVLKPNGEFLYMLSYGADDQEAQGRWRVTGKQVQLISMPSQQAGEPFKLAAASRDPTLNGVIARWRVDAAPLRGLDVVVGGVDRQKAGTYAPEGADGYWRLGGIEQPGELAVRHPQIASGRWFFITLPQDKDGQASNKLDFMVDVESAGAAEAFSASLEVTGTALLMSGPAGRPMRYERH